MQVGSCCGLGQGSIIFCLVTVFCYSTLVMNRTSGDLETAFIDIITWTKDSLEYRPVEFEINQTSVDSGQENSLIISSGKFIRK